MTRRERAKTFRDAVMGGTAPLAAIQAIAQAEGVPPRRIVADLRSTRWLVVNTRDLDARRRDLVPLFRKAELPADVVVIPYGWTPEQEAARARILDVLCPVSALPSVIVWIPPRQGVDENGDPVVIPGHWEAQRVTRKETGERSTWAWRQYGQSLDRTLPRVLWALAKEPPTEVPEE